VPPDSPTGLPESPFWHYSTAVYAREGVAPACLRLQERHGIDVNIVLMCCWCAQEDHRLIDNAEMCRLVGAVSGWHRSVVRELRAVRKRLKGGLPPVPEDLVRLVRERVLQTEIDCEQVEQHLLYQLATVNRPSARAETQVAAAAVNLKTYFSSLHIGLTDADLADCGEILASCIPSADAATARQYLK
jgi:uncharacterized protein (TIGR02444 family)